MSTCFCTSMGTGPEVDDGADLVLAELDEGYVVTVGSPAGEAIVEPLALRPALPSEIDRAGEQVAAGGEDPAAPAPPRGPRGPPCPRAFSARGVGVASDLDGVEATRSASGT